MKKPRSSFLKNLLSALVIVLQVSAFPMSAYAEGTPESSTSTASETIPSEPAPAEAPVPPPAVSTPAATSPSNATTPETIAPEPAPYTLNPNTGNYENDKYIWNPSTYQTTPKIAPTYSYNTASGMWETTQWQYDANSGTYVPSEVTSSPVPPIAAPATPSTNNIANAAPSNQSSDSSNPLSVTNSTNDSQQKPSGSLNELPVMNGSESTSFFSGYYNAAISNNIDSFAKSGDVQVTQNTVAGSALSGDASAIANVINLLQSSWGVGGSGNIATFLANIDGSVVGDLMIDPGQIANKSLTTTASPDSSVKVNVDNNGTINNNINLAAESGSATVSGNMSAGDAISGNAMALANVINAINSTISSGQSFFGVININGNLDGDILMPPSTLDYLMAASAPRTTVSSASLPSEITTNLTNNQTVNNNINASAESGTATVNSNTMAGNATSGDASTDVTILNLTGSNIIAKNSMLVFVNVLGEWVGLIMNAPAGSTSAAYASGVSSNTPQLYPGYTNSDTDITNNQTINNNINVSAKTGNAAVTGNTLAGDAASGDATAKVNLINILNSNLAFSDWFGVLFINVLGKWHGSFGINTAAGNNQNQTNSGTPPVFTFVPGNNSEKPGIPVTTAQRQNLRPQTYFASAPQTEQNDDQEVLPASASSSQTPGTPAASTKNTAPASSNLGLYAGLGGLSAILLAAGIYRLIASRREQELMASQL